MIDDPFAALGLSRDAGVEQVREARRNLAKQHHPDQGGDPARMRSINEAADAALAEVESARHPSSDESERGDVADPASTVWQQRGPNRPRTDVDDRPVQRDVPSFTVEALPVDTFEGLLVVTSWLGEVIDDEPPYRLDAYLNEPFDCWCRLDVVPDAGSSTVSLTISGIDGGAAPDILAVRDAWVDGLNALSVLPPS